MIDPQDICLVDCPTYEDYLDMFNTTSDYRLVRNVTIARQLVALNFKSSTTIYSKDIFEQRKNKVLAFLFPIKRSFTGLSVGLKPKDPVIREIAMREKPNIQKVLSTIMFITARLNDGFEVSSYMDLEDSIRDSYEHDDGRFWTAVFEERVKLRPRPDHLSYFDYQKNKVFHNNSNNYNILHDIDDGLTFIHKGDHKKIIVGNKRSKNFIESTVHSPVYGFVKFYDHAVHKKM